MQHTATLDAALGYAALGLRVVPLARRSKTPLIERWPQRGTCDASQIECWFESWPDANLAILLGQGVIALDIDPRNGGKGSWRKLLGRRTLPETAHALTGAGGHHYLFRVGPGVRITTKDGLRPGVDLKGEGGLLVVEPSVHPATGKEYVWLRTPRQGIAMAPAWLLALLPRVGATATGVPARPPRPTRMGEESALLERILRRFPVGGPGERHRQMTRAVGSLVGRGYADEVIVRVILAWHDHFAALGLTATGRGQAEREIVACLGSARRNPAFRAADSGIDHREKLAEITLNAEQERLIREGIIQEGDILVTEDTRDTPLPCNRVTRDGMKLCQSDQERAFVTAWTIYMSYKVHVLGEHPPKATRDQIRAIIADRHGVSLENPQWERLMRKYVTRPGKPATRCELAIQTLKGEPGIPSGYEVTGLLQLIAPPEAPGASVAGLQAPPPLLSAA